MKHKNKKLSRRCPECGGWLESVDYSEYNECNGITFTYTVIECTECDFTEKQKPNRNTRNKDTDEW